MLIADCRPLDPSLSITPDALVRGGGHVHGAVIDVGGALLRDEALRQIDAVNFNPENGTRVGGPRHAANTSSMHTGLGRLPEVPLTSKSSKPTLQNSSLSIPSSAGQHHARYKHLVPPQIEDRVMRHNSGQRL